MHVCVPLVLHAWVAFGAQVAPVGQEHVPQAHEELHVSVPNELHACVVVGAQLAPAGHEHAPQEHVVGSQVRVP